jgi:hypothetical protein
MPKIVPTVGRVVWFYLGQSLDCPDGFERFGGRGPYAAEIVHVWNDLCVNLSVKDSSGRVFSFTSVINWDGSGDDRLEMFWCWMPFQKLEPDLDNLFTYHAPKPELNQAKRYQDIRDHAKYLAEHMTRQCPESRERSLAIQKIEEAVFWANAAIARHE